jgi:glucose-6-phosphate isomerase
MDSAAWKALQAHYDQHGESINMRDLFETDANRFENFRCTLLAAALSLRSYVSLCSVETDLGDGPFLFDYSKNLVDEAVLGKLLDLARERGVEQGRDDMFG